MVLWYGKHREISTPFFRNPAGGTCEADSCRQRSAGAPFDRGGTDLIAFVQIRALYTHPVCGRDDEERKGERYEKGVHGPRNSCPALAAP